MQLSVALTVLTCALGIEPCSIQVIDRESRWPVPLVELRTTHDVRLVTDNAGVIAFDLPELMGRETWFDVVGHGYDVPKDGFGMRGVRLTPEPGKTLTVEVDRKNLARRVGRITGAGLFAESQKSGREMQARESGLVGCDSVQCAVHRGRMHWLWGDTKLARYPLGIFHSTGATSSLQRAQVYEPPLKLELDYFRDSEGAPRAISTMPGEGPTWVTGMVSLPSASGEPRLVGAYMKIKPPLDAWQWGLCAWNESTANFEPLRTLWTKSDATPKPPALPEGHAVFWKDDAGKEWVLFGNPLPTLRCPATFEAWQDPSTWEKLTQQSELADVDGGGAVKPHSGSIAWSSRRKKWVTVFMQHFGKPSVFGEVWYAEARKPTGPWGPAIKVLTHENYTFYNPRVHAELAGDAPIVLFEGTYTATFADRPPPTPRYDYNQILYSLDLGDSRLSALGN